MVQTIKVWGGMGGMVAIKVWGGNGVEVIHVLKFFSRDRVKG
jgi:hypothetical protein